ncbi:hypothetical protein NDU88_001651, partial [Pleurodeles waltl]
VELSLGTQRPQKRLPLTPDEAISEEDTPGLVDTEDSKGPIWATWSDNQSTPPSS